MHPGFHFTEEEKALWRDGNKTQAVRAYRLKNPFVSLLDLKRAFEEQVGPMGNNACCIHCQENERRIIELEQSVTNLGNAVKELNWKANKPQF